MEDQLIAVLVLIADLAVGVVFCFFGNRWLRAILGVYGFAVGFLTANTLVPLITSVSGTVQLLISIAAGAVGALIFVFALYLGIFFIGFGGGLMLCVLLAEVLSLNLLDWFVYVPALIISCSLGALTLNQRRIFIAIFTSFIGACALAQFIDQIVNGIGTQPLVLYSRTAALSTYASPVYLIALAALFFVGLIVQLAVTSKE